MTALHLVHIAPASPERLKKDAYTRLLSTARNIRLAHLNRLFQSHGLRVDDLFVIEGKISTPRPEVHASETAIADLTQKVRLRCSAWTSARPGRLDHNPTELARKISDYLDVDTQVGPRLQQWASAYAARRVGPPPFEKLDAASKALLRMGSGPLRLVGPETDCCCCV